MNIVMGATGNTIRGHVLDVNPKALERSLKQYDKLLYLKWNPKKLKGWGVWEIRRAPAKKTMVDLVPFGNATIIQLEHQELDIVNHIMDVPYLGYNVLNKLSDMDTFKMGTKAWADKLESDRLQYEVDANIRAKRELKYFAKQNKQMIKDFKEAILSGTNPADIANYWNKSGS